MIFGYIMQNILIPNKDDFESKVKKIISDGSKKLHILSDFDGTLTKEFVNGKKVPSIISHLRDGSYLTKEYAEKAHELYDRFHPIEIDPNLSKEEKSRKMLEWWTTHYDLLMKTGLNKKDIKKIILDGKIVLREGIDKFLEMLDKKNIPLIIMSSSGLGDAIPLALKHEKLLFPNIYTISNSFIWDRSGKATKIKEPIIHSYNKKEIVIKDFPIYDDIKERKNVILLGNTIADIDMIEGFECDILLKIGFLNDEKETPIEEFKKHFDVVLLNDQGMDFINDLLKNIE